MKPTRTRPGPALNKAGWALIALLLLLNSGCLGVVAGVAAAGGAATAGYFYVSGPRYRDYPASLERAHAAVLAGLTEMQLQEQPRKATTEAGKLTVETRLTNGTITKIILTSVGPPIPADGPVTRIAVRVGTFGDEELSARFLDVIGKYLPPPGPLAAPGMAAPPGVSIQPTSGHGPAPVVGTPRPIESPPPPLAK